MDVNLFVYTKEIFMREREERERPMLRTVAQVVDELLSAVWCARLTVCV